MRCEWKQVLLSDIMKFKNGKKRPATTGDIPVYGGNGILNFTNEANCQNCIVIGRVGAYCGSVFREPQKCWVSDNAICCTAKENSDAIFDYYLLKNLQLNKRHIGTSQPLLTQEILNKIEIICPPLTEQKRIAAILSALDDKIELNQRINDNLEWQAQALFKSWFVDFEPFGGSVPSGWERIKFSTFLTASTDKSNDPLLPMFSVTDAGIYPRDEKFKKNLSMTNSKNKIVRQTDLVFGMSREILNWGIMRDPIGGVSSAYNVYNVSNQINSFYLESYIKANYSYFKDLIKPASREGQGIDKNALMQKEIIMPPQTVLDQYYLIENIITKTACHAMDENQRLTELRDTLLPRLMSGEIDMSVSKL